MRFFAQLIMTALFGALLTLLLITAIPTLTGWQGWYVFWPSFFIGMAGGAQLAYWLSGFIPEPTRPPVLEDEDSQWIRFNGETEEADEPADLVADKADAASGLFNGQTEKTDEPADR
jgi:hypothetical protein